MPHVSSDRGGVTQDGAMTFRLAMIDDRPALVDTAGRWHDLGRLHDHDFDRYEVGRGPLRASELHRLDATLDDHPTADGDFAEALSAGRVGPPIPTPRSCFAVGLNYRDHAAESAMDPPENPLVFTKFPSCIVGPTADIELRSEFADWEVELVVVIGDVARDVSVDDAWDHVFGLTIGQDVSDRRLQFAAKPPHFDLGKSRDSYGPIGPMVLSLDAVDDHTALDIKCMVNGTVEQHSSTSSMIFGVPELVAYLSSILTLSPGDVIFTGTPDGVGMARTPPVYLRPGDVIASTIEGIGSMQNRCV